MSTRAQFSLESPHPTVLLGDFNCEPDDMQAFLAKFGFVDAWAELHPSDPGLTFSAWVPAKRCECSAQHAREVSHCGAQH